VTPDAAAARDAIRELVAAYAHAGDGGRFDALCALFAADGVLELDGGRVCAGRDAIRAFLAATVASRRADATAHPFVRHHVSSVSVTLDDATHAHGASYFFVVTERGPDHWGRYRDRYVRDADGWHFAHRRVRVDGMAPGSWAAGRRGTLGDPA
jgi:uncharacterized protein (TIGR02246 family)